MIKEEAKQKEQEIFKKIFSIEGVAKKVAYKASIEAAILLKDATNDVVYQCVINNLREKLENYEER